ncbi:preprotein translocase subunit SecA [Candidatus Melainabacteria bacterium MEL.A1]|jgi:preprotein translocase, secA subunit|nr:preprotein translocase subunit SecA [Candidatus Melainabacteria bacterium MEL.A1]CCX79540.1 protein translocase subunit SecA [Clostridium sp. CAG:715]
MLSFLLKLLGDPNEKKVKSIMGIIDHINALEPQFEKLTDEELRAKTDEFKEILAKRPTSKDFKTDRKLEKEALDKILPEAFATVREAGKRVLNMRHFDVQLIGGYFLHNGHIAEMRTGEGKTLVATLPAYLNALTGKGVHVITVNDYLAKRDSDWMGKIYKFLGLSVGVILSGGRSAEDFAAKKAAYACDITYGTNNEFGFDYLRDNMASNIEMLVQRPYNYAIIDEVDSILIDEARTPLIISGRLEKSAETYQLMAKVAPQLEKIKDYEVDEKNKNIILTEDGIDHAQEIIGVKDLFDINTQYAHHLLQALKAKELFVKDTDYVVKNGEVMIVDEFTGRLMEGRRWSDGLHQAIEAKEGVQIQDETQTLASITFQNLFRLYPKLSGMTGTAMTEEAEFGKIYNLEVTTIPTNKPDIRINYPDVIYKTERAKFDAVVQDIIRMHEIGRPVLVGTISIEKSEYVSYLLKQKGIPHHVLNAKHHEKEAYIIAQAGRVGAVTIATNMAGRGTDILLGGNAEFLAKEMLDEKGITPESENYAAEKEAALAQARAITEKEHAKVVEVGGLHVIGTERHESRRIDNQLRGRAARQGDPGSTRFFLSLQDNLMRIFGGEKITALMNALNVEDDIAIENVLITRQIQSAQKKVETYHFDIRKSVLEYDDVMNIQREKFYAQRRKVLAGKNLSEDIYYMIEKEIDRLLRSYIAPDLHPEEYVYEDLQTMIKELHSIIPQLSGVQVSDIQNLRFEPIFDKLKTLAIGAYRQHEEEVVNFYNQVVTQYDQEAPLQEAFSDNNVIRSLEKDILLRVVDNKWIDHLHNIDMLREGIGLRAYGQKDPLIEYKREAYDLFNKMMYEIQGDTVKHLFRTKFGIQVIGPEPDGGEVA